MNIIKIIHNLWSHNDRFSKTNLTAKYPTYDLRLCLVDILIIIIHRKVLELIENQNRERVKYV